MRKFFRRWRCNRGKYDKLICLCPPSYYRDQCQHQNQRVSLTLQLQAIANFRMVFTIIIMLIDNEGQINSYEYFNYLEIRDCNICKTSEQCVPFDERSINNQWYCICKEGYSDKQCNTNDRKIIVSFYDTEIPLSFLIHFIYVPGDRPHERTTTFIKVLFHQNMVTTYSSIPFHLISYY
ncbi:unnamed protein product [Rotaria sp. Silwood2]|nr:unnamed protein product [Rotaria sp. Silwood2]